MFWVSLPLRWAFAKGSPDFDLDFKPDFKPDFHIHPGKPFKYRLPEASIAKFGGGPIRASLPDGSPLPSWLHFDKTFHSFSGTPPRSAHFQGSLLLKGMNRQGSVSLPLRWAIATGALPIARGFSPEFSIHPGKPFTYRLPKALITQLGGGDLSFSAFLPDGSPLPSWLRYDPASHSLLGTPPRSVPFEGTVLLKAINRQGSLSLPLRWVSEPVLPGLADAVAVVGRRFELQLPSWATAGARPYATLAGGQPLPSWLHFNADDLRFHGTAPDQESLHIHLGPVGNGFRLRVVGGTLDAKAAALAARPLELARPEFPASRYCAEADVIYEPMDPHPQVTSDLVECQLLCRRTKGCGYWTFFYPLKTCHFSAFQTSKRTYRLGFQGGPAVCGEIQGLGSASLEDGLLAQKCLVQHTSFSPLYGQGRPESYETSAAECQKQCQKTSWCATFVYDSLSKGCNLQEWNAVAIPAAEHQAAGPRECSVGLDLNLTLRASDADSHRSKWETLLKAALVRAAGNYSSDTEPPKPLLDVSEISFTALSRQPNELALAVDMDSSSRRSLYIHQLLNSPKGPTFQHAMEDFMNQTQSMLELGPFHLSLDQWQLDVEGDDFPARYATKAFSAIPPIVNPSWGSPVWALSAVTAAMLAVTLVSVGRKAFTATARTSENWAYAPGMARVSSRALAATHRSSDNPEYSALDTEQICMFP
ncbi:unnamed protein product [Effrenium voratum]|uniref:Apple domain-containing protein n=1 Tax=Effrenium voratum TaxID=2562239 RepID=A0AA36HMM6_9DINO|nr:unnamed protein product [Effrenium voratum]